jgi:transposase
MWVPPENKDPVLFMAPTRKSISLFGAVNVFNGKLVTQFEKRFNAISLKRFLVRLLRHRPEGKTIVVLLDNAKYHHAIILRPFLRENRDVFRLMFLPSYSPELNPIERVWKLTRKLCTHNKYFETLDQLSCAVSKRLTLWKRPNEVLRRLCCIN